MANNSFTLVSANSSFNEIQSGEKKFNKINWKNCFICQTNSHGQMICPAKKQDGNYQKIIDDIKRFKPFDKLSPQLSYQISSEKIVS